MLYNDGSEEDFIKQIGRCSAHLNSVYGRIFKYSFTTILVCIIMISAAMLYFEQKEAGAISFTVNRYKVRV